MPAPIDYQFGGIDSLIGVLRNSRHIIYKLRQVHIPLHVGQHGLIKQSRVRSEYGGVTEPLRSSADSWKIIVKSSYLGSVLAMIDDKADIER